VWSFLDYREQGTTSDLVFAVGSALGGVILVIYFKAVLRKLKNISYL